MAYSFQPQFVEPTWSGRKVHTIRAIGKRRHARPAESLQHYTGMRTKSCRLFARSVCEKVLPIRLTFARNPVYDVVQIDDPDRNIISFLTTPAELDAFARSDGFESWAAMRVFWKRTHDADTNFDGLIIYWRDMERFDDGIRLCARPS